MKNDTKDNGLAIPKNGYIVFIKNPINIRLARLNPTVYKRTGPLRSIPSRSNKRSKRMPGTNKMNMNPTIFLRIGIFIPA